MMKKIIFWLILFLSLSVVRADESTPLVVWAENGDLGVWQAGTSQIFSVGNLIFPKLSPSGEQVALLRGDNRYPEFLSVISIQDGNLRDVDTRYPRWVEWQSETILWVNTYVHPSEGELDITQDTLLYRVDLATGAIRQWDMGEPFRMTMNPSRTWLALVFAGIYQQAEGRISLLSLANDEMIAQQVMTFPAISSASHGGYYPTVQWITDDVAYVAIPHPDALYT
nr:hypothetical protein [Anaerolineae bacterium]